MSTHKNIDRICCGLLALMLVATVLFMSGESLGLNKYDSPADETAYSVRLFDTSVVHRVDIVMNNWDEFIENCENEEYYPCNIYIDGEAYKNVGIRAKGNTSLSQVSAYGNDRYSFKIEFDRYTDGVNYYGLDKLCLNNIIQDNTYMKDYFAYEMMRSMGVTSSLCSYVNVSINGEVFGLYLAVEGVEDSFMARNYEGGDGELYKPDSMSFGGGRGNGKDFSMDEFMNGSADTQSGEDVGFSSENVPERFSGRRFGEISGNAMDEQMLGPDMPESGNMRDMFSGSGGGMGRQSGSSDVSLIYSDDNYESYSNIFDNAKTDITDEDKDRLISSLKVLNEGEDVASVVDVDSVIRYFVVHNFLVNFDSYTGSIIHNYYLYETDGVLSMIPWDYNLALGGFSGAGGAENLVNYPIDSPVSGGDVSSRPMLAWIFADEEYTALYHKYFADFIGSYFDSGYFSQEISRVKEMISPYVENDPTKFCSYEEFEEAAAVMEDFCTLRAESVSLQISGEIPSTSGGQNDFNGEYVSAGDMNISAMGGMGAGGMGMPGGTNRPSGSNESTKEDASSDEGSLFPPFEGMPDMGGMQVPDNMRIPDGMPLPEGMRSPSFSGEESSSGSEAGMGGFGGNRSQRGQNASGNADIQGEFPAGNLLSSEIVLTAVSAIVLVIALFVVLKYKRYR